VGRQNGKIGANILILRKRPRGKTNTRPTSTADVAGETRFPGLLAGVRGREDRRSCASSELPARKEVILTGGCRRASSRPRAAWVGLDVQQEEHVGAKMCVPHRDKSHVEGWCGVLSGVGGWGGGDRNPRTESKTRDHVSSSRAEVAARTRLGDGTSLVLLRRPVPQLRRAPVDRNVDDGRIFAPLHTVETLAKTRRSSQCDRG